MIPKRMTLRLLLVTLIAIAASGETAFATAAPISYTDLLARKRPAADRIVPYGPAPQQRGELFLPATPGLHPVAVLMHGGCWLAELPGTELMGYIAADLRARGVAVWNIDYRRIGNVGGGYPGTFLDVSSGIDFLRTLAPAYRLDLARIVAVGHSAGGQLALWAAARRRLPKNSPLYRRNPLPLAGAVSLAGIDDLLDYREHGPSACGGPSTVDALTGRPQPARKDVYGDTSPVRLLPIGVPYVLVSGTLDPIVPMGFAHRFAARGRAAGENPRTIDVDGAGHFELIDPHSAAWKTIADEIERLAK
jgi:acetyl esterase/lipase